MIFSAKRSRERIPLILDELSRDVKNRALDSFVEVGVGGRDKTGKWITSILYVYISSFSIFLQSGSFFAFLFH